MEWTRWLAKIYAEAIRWSFWDGKSTMTFTGDAEDLFARPGFLTEALKPDRESYPLPW